MLVQLQHRPVDLKRPVPRQLINYLLTKTANTDTGQGKTKINASVSHLLHGNSVGNRICHVAHFVGWPRLQHQRRFSGNQRSAE